MSTDLFQAKIESEAQKIAAVKIQEALNDPLQLKALLVAQIDAHQSAVKRAVVAEEKVTKLSARLKRYFDADGFIDAAVVAATLRIPYIGPDGKALAMGRNYALKVFEIDGIVINTRAGYRLSSEWEKSGRGITRVTEKNGYLRSVALFNSAGVKALVARYEKDTREWKSNTNREVWHD